jgi:hypothetical protein
MSASDDHEETPSRYPIRRKVVTPDRLLRLLNQRMEHYGHCHNCRFVGPIRKLEEPTEDGRNWSRFVALVCASGVAGGCARIAERILEDATVEYNLPA